MAISPEVRKKIRAIQITTRRLLRGAVAGDYKTALKGSGFEFDQLREYSQGDDVRFIDWSASVRSDKLFVRQYLEDRNRYVHLLVDVSASEKFSSGDTLKSDLVAHVVSVLALVANHGKDVVGLTLFSDDVECRIKPARGLSHCAHVIEKVFAHECAGTGTNIANALESLMRSNAPRGIVFIVSDFIDVNFEKALHVLNRKHDVVAVRCLDTAEINFPVGGLHVCDPETGKSVVVPRKEIVSELFAQRIAEQDRMFKKLGIDVLQVTPGRPYMHDIISFFKQRMT